MSTQRIDAEELRRRYHTEPFRPFTIVLDDSARIIVKQRLRFGIAPSGSFIIAVLPNGDFTTASIARIVAIEEGLPKTRRKTSNGTHRRRKTG